MLLEILILSEVSWKEKDVESKTGKNGSSYHGAAETNTTRNHEFAGSIPGLAQWAKDPALL